MLLRLAACALLIGCSDEAHSLIVDVRTDLAPGIEFVLARGTLSPSGGEQTVGAPVGAPFGDGVRLGEWDDLSPGNHELTVAAVDNLGNAVVERRVVAEIRGNLAITVVLTRSCREVACTGATTCNGGRCVDASCSELDPDACGEPECSAAGDCTTSTACVVPACVEGACFEAPEDSRCGAAEVCHPERDCIAAGADAGPGDDSGVDAGFDAGAVDAGPADSGGPDSDAADAGVAIVTSPTQLSADVSAGPDIAWSGSVLGVVWESRTEIFFRRVDGVTGLPIGAIVRVSDADPAQSRFAALDWVGDGWGVVWRDLRSGTERIYYAHLAPDGTKLGGDVLITPSSRGLDPDIAWSGSTVAVTWLDDRHGGGDREVYLARIRTDGSMLGETRVTTSSGRAANQHIAVTGGNWVIVWDEDLPAGGRDVFYTRVGPGGAETGADTNLTMTGNAVEPAIAPGMPDAIGVVFEDLTETIPFFTRLAPSTGTTTPVVMLTGAAIATNPDPVWVPSGRWNAYWEEDVATTRELRGRGITPGGAGPVQTLTADDPAISEDPTSVWTGRSVAIAWEDARGGARHIWIQLRAPL